MQTKLIEKDATMFCSSYAGTGASSIRAARDETLTQKRVTFLGFWELPSGPCTPEYAYALDEVADHNASLRAYYSIVTFVILVLLYLAARALL
jgi:hypothetical protein